MVYFHYEWTWGESEFSKGLASTKATKNLCEYKSVYRYLKNVKKPSYFVKFEWNSISDSFKPKSFLPKVIYFISLYLRLLTILSSILVEFKFPLCYETFYYENKFHKKYFFNKSIFFSPFESFKSQKEPKKQIFERD